MKLVWNIKNVEFSSFLKNKILFFDSWPSCLECQKKIYSDKHKHSLFGHFLLGATELRNYSLWAADSMSYLVKLSDMYCQTKDGHFCLCTVIRIPDLESFAGDKAWESCKKKKSSDMCWLTCFLPATHIPYNDPAQHATLVVVTQTW